MDRELYLQFEEEKKRARRRAERARYWKKKLPLVAQIFRLNALPKAGLWFDDETLHHLEPSAANVATFPVEPQFKASSLEELFQLQAAAAQSAEIPGYNAYIGLRRPTYSFEPPLRFRVATYLADHPKGKGPIYIY